MYVNSSYTYHQLLLTGAATKQAGNTAADTGGSSVRLVGSLDEPSSAAWPTTVEVPPRSGTPLEFGDWLARTANYRAAVRSTPESGIPPTALQDTEEQPAHASSRDKERDEVTFGPTAAVAEQSEATGDKPGQADEK